jgi:transposase-like protein
MLGFRGHFSTKSRRYSTTLGALRAARAAHQRQDAGEVTIEVPRDRAGTFDPQIVRKRQLRGGGAVLS